MRLHQKISIVCLSVVSATSTVLLDLNGGEKAGDAKNLIADLKQVTLEVDLEINLEKKIYDKSRNQQQYRHRRKGNKPSIRVQIPRP